MLLKRTLAHPQQSGAAAISRSTGKIDMICVNRTRK
jgi:hypothetical protein